jgi:hypothetical protein
VQGQALADRLVAQHGRADAERRHQEGAPLGHELQDLVVGEGAVLDGAGAGLDGVADALLGVGVGGHVAAVVLGDPHGGGDLFLGELDGAGLLAFRRQHGAGGHDLDQVGALGELPAGRRHDGIGPVAEVVHAGVVVGAAGGDRQQLAGQVEARGRELAGRGRLAHGHLGVVPAAHVAHRGEAGQQSALGRLGGLQGDQGILAPSRFVDVRAPGRHGQVHMAIDQPGQQPAAGQVDHPHALGGGGLAGDLDDPLVLDHQLAGGKASLVDVVDLGIREPEHHYASLMAARP